MAKGSSPIKSNDDCQVEDDLRTLCRAEEIKDDPKRLAKCQAMAKDKMKGMAAIASEGADKD